MNTRFNNRFYGKKQTSAQFIILLNTNRCSLSPFVVSALDTHDSNNEDDEADGGQNNNGYEQSYKWKNKSKEKRDIF